MFITIQINHYAYVTGTTMLLFQIVDIEIHAFVPSLLKYINLRFVKRFADKCRLRFPKQNTRRSHGGICSRYGETFNHIFCDSSALRFNEMTFFDIPNPR